MLLIVYSKRKFLTLCLSLFFSLYTTYHILNTNIVEAFTINQPQNGGVIVNRTQASGPQIQVILKNVITLFFSVAAVGFTIYLMWGALEWILSGGDKEKVASARKKITHAMIGLLILSLTFVIMIVIGQILSINLFSLEIPKFNP